MVCLFYRVFEDECVLPLYFTVLGPKPRFINKWIKGAKIAFLFECDKELFSLRFENDDHGVKHDLDIER